ncbi:MAG: 50S ribosomal protein L10 [Planctomycetes bacterium]|nr:50S ribosomal protein L10 [Planctomycetota bacterium]
MSKAVKNMLVAEIRDRIGETRDMLVVDSSRLDAISSNRFRLAMQERQITLLTVKNTLARLALKEAGVRGLDPILEGPSTLVWGSEDIVALSREISKWAKDLAPLEVKGGSVEGTTLNAAAVEDLSKSPSREELIGQIVGLMLSPGARLAAAMLGPGGKLSGQLKALADKEEGEPAPA